MNISNLSPLLFFRLTLIFVASISLSACAGSSAKVVSSNNYEQAAIPQSYGPKKRVAVARFSVRAPVGGSELGNGMSDMLLSALVNTGRFTVLERERLDEVTAEQDLAKSDRFRSETVAPTGQLEGAQWLVKGSIIQFKPDCKGGSAIIVSAKQACLTLNLRVIEVATGRILSATTVEGTATNKGVGLVYTPLSLPVGLGAWSKTPVETAIRESIEAAVAHIVATSI